MSDRRPAEESTKQGHRRPGVDAEFVQYMEADPATVTGGNTAYGNAPRNQGVRFTSPNGASAPGES